MQRNVLCATCRLAAQMAGRRAPRYRIRHTDRRALNRRLERTRLCRYGRHAGARRRTFGAPTGAADSGRDIGGSTRAVVGLELFGSVAHNPGRIARPYPGSSVCVLGRNVWRNIEAGVLGASWLVEEFVERIVGMRCGTSVEAEVPRSPGIPPFYVTRKLPLTSAAGFQVALPP